MTDNTQLTAQPSSPVPSTDPNDITIFAKTNYRNEMRRFGIKLDDRRRHFYVIGKTGMGKSTLLENMIIQDIQKGNGVAVVDPHGDLVEKVLGFIPTSRINDVVHFNPGDYEYPIAFNILESVAPELRNLVSNGLVGVFKKIWADSWGPRLEYILINTILALLEYPGSTLLGVTRMLVDAKYRRKVVNNVTDPVVKQFWVEEYNNYSERFRNEAIAPIQNKVGQFLSSSLIRNIVGQSKSRLNMRELMDQRKILLMHLSKGSIGEENSALLGAMMITKIQLAAMSRVNVPEEERVDFYLYVDEFQNFATDSFANILSEARKYRLNLIMAHQYIEQLSDEVRAAVFGNIGTLIMFRVGGVDAEELEKEFQPTFMQENLVTLAKYNVYLRLMIDGVASEPFSATTLPPVAGRTDNREKVIRVSRERYSRPRKEIEEKIIRWAGMEDMMRNDDTDDDDQHSKAWGNDRRPMTRPAPIKPFRDQRRDRAPQRPAQSPQSRAPITPFKPQSVAAPSSQPPQVATLRPVITPSTTSIPPPRPFQSAKVQGATLPVSPPTQPPQRVVLTPPFVETSTTETITTDKPRRKRRRRKHTSEIAVPQTSSSDN